MANTIIKSGSLSSFLLLFLLAFTFQTQNVEGANILGLFTSHSPSHLIVHMSVVKALAEKGHNVTVVSSLRPKVTHANITHIIIPPSAEQEKKYDALVTNIAESGNNLWTAINMMLNSMTLMMDMQFDVLRSKRFTALYDQSDTKFDLVIYGFFFNDFQLGVPAKFNAPVIVDWSSGPMDFINDYIGNPRQWSYVPNMKIGVKQGESMTFRQRVQNFISSMMYQGLGVTLEMRYNRFYKKLFSKDNIPSIADMRKNVSLVFTNSHYSEGPIRPNVPALVEIGGIQVKGKPDPLPKNIADHLNAAKKHGAILFCLGSNVKSKSVKPEKVAIIFKVLSGLKQNVIWKWDDFDNLPGTSPNILYIKWLPQDDILAHPNLKLFITHAGKGGIAEAQYHAVPMVALPLFAEQAGNAQRMSTSGFGVEINMQHLNEDEFRNAVNEVLTNPTYKNNVQKFSQLYRDRPMTAKESVVYWTEYVIRHHGAAHMQSPLVHMNRIQALNLDVVGFIVGVLVIVLSVLWFTVKFIYVKCCKSKKGYEKVKRQ